MTNRSMAKPILIPDATAEPEVYVQALLDVLGDREPIGVYAETPAKVLQQCGRLSDGEWHAPPAPAEWTAYELVGHLLDVDIVYGFRWRLMLTADRPSYPGYYERAWARLPKPPPADLVPAFVGLRSANVALVRSVTDEDRERQGIHGEQGLEDVDRMIHKIAGHDLAHLDQLDRVVRHATAKRMDTSGRNPSSVKERTQAPAERS
jgi:hypothetical protein